MREPPTGFIVPRGFLDEPRQGPPALLLRFLQGTGLLKWSKPKRFEANLKKKLVDSIIIIIIIMILVIIIVIII